MWLRTAHKEAISSHCEWTMDTEGPYHRQVVDTSPSLYLIRPGGLHSHPCMCTQFLRHSYLRTVIQLLTWGSFRSIPTGFTLVFSILSTSARVMCPLCRVFTIVYMFLLLLCVCAAELCRFGMCFLLLRQSPVNTDQWRRRAGRLQWHRCWHRHCLVRVLFRTRRGMWWSLGRSLGSTQ